jgi:hypothetical protein
MIVCYSGIEGEIELDINCEEEAELNNENENTDIYGSCSWKPSYKPIDIPLVPPSHNLAIKWILFWVLPRNLETDVRKSLVGYK